MPGIPANLHARCRKALLQFREFESYDNLRVLFAIEELAPYRDGLRNADSPSLLVDKLIEYFVYIDEQKLTNGRSIFQIFLDILIDRAIEGMSVQEELVQLQEDLQAVTIKSTQHSADGIQAKNKIFDMLMRLDFSSQIQAVRNIIDKQDVAAFLVHGPPEFGQSTLTYRLSHIMPQWNSGRYITVDAAANGIGKSSYSLWREIAKRLELSAETDPQKLAEKVVQWTETQDVIIVIQAVDYIPSSILFTWMEEFWKVTVVVAQAHKPLGLPRKHLLLFLVDYGGTVYKESGEIESQIFTTNPAKLLSHHLSLVLPSNKEFPETELDLWFDMASDVLPIRPNTKDVLNDTMGIPNRVYEKICSICGISWEGELVP